MPGLREHAERSKTLYGDSANEIHEYIDSAYEVYRGSHRKIRHDLEITPTEVEEIFGEKHKHAKDITIDHVWFDAMDSLSKIGEIGEDYLIYPTCSIRFMKPHFVDIACENCGNPRIEKFANVWVWDDWEKRHNHIINIRRLSIIDLLFRRSKFKPPKLSPMGSVRITICYCYKCHKLTHKGIEALPEELIDDIVFLERVALLKAVGHSISIKDYWVEARGAKPAPEKIVSAKRFRIIPLIVGFLWLFIGLGVFANNLAKYLKWSYIAAWMLLFGIPCIILFKLSFRRVETVKKTSDEETLGLTTIAKENTEHEATSIYREAFPELSEEEAELQETQEVDMDFQDEEEDS